jgi:small-conductance mechanosensitive channel
MRHSEAQIAQLKAEKATLQAALDKLKTQSQEIMTKSQDQTWKVKDAEEKLRKSEAAVKEKEEARLAAQTELDDLFVVLGDLEDKRTKDKVSLCHGGLSAVEWEEFVDAIVLTCGDRNDLKSSERRFPMEMMMRMRTTTATMTMPMKTRTRTRTRTKKTKKRPHRLQWDAMR